MAAGGGVPPDMAVFLRRVPGSAHAVHAGDPKVGKDIIQIVLSDKPLIGTETYLLKHKGTEAG